MTSRSINYTVGALKELSCQCKYKHSSQQSFQECSEILTDGTGTLTFVWKQIADSWPAFPVH